MNPFQAFLHLLSDPNIAFLLFTIGFYGLIFELQNPNFVTGILGGARDHPRLHRLRQPAAQRRGAAADRPWRSSCSCSRHTVTSHGLLTVGGIICFALGASALLHSRPAIPTRPFVQVAAPLIVCHDRSRRPVHGSDRLVGRPESQAPGQRPASSAASAAGSQSDRDRRGPGAAGSSRIRSTPLARSGPLGWPRQARWSGATSVRVVGVDGLTAVVEPDTSSSTSQPVSRAREADSHRGTSYRRIDRRVPRRRRARRRLPVDPGGPAVRADGRVPTRARPTSSWSGTRASASWSRSSIVPSRSTCASSSSRSRARRRSPGTTPRSTSTS